MKNILKKKVSVVEAKCPLYLNPTVHVPDSDVHTRHHIFPILDYFVVLVVALQKLLFLHHLLHDARDLNEALSIVAVCQHTHYSGDNHSYWEI